MHVRPSAPCSLLLVCRQHACSITAVMLFGCGRLCPHPNPKGPTTAAVVGPPVAASATAGAVMCSPPNLSTNPTPHHTTSHANLITGHHRHRRHPRRHPRHRHRPRHHHCPGRRRRHHGCPRLASPALTRHSLTSPASPLPPRLPRLPSPPPPLHPPLDTLVPPQHPRPYIPAFPSLTPFHLLGSQLPPTL